MVSLGHYELTVEAVGVISVTAFAISYDGKAVTGLDNPLIWAIYMSQQITGLCFLKA